MCLQALTPRGRVVGADDPAAVEHEVLEESGMTVKITRLSFLRPGPERLAGAKP